MSEDNIMLAASQSMFNPLQQQYAQHASRCLYTCPPCVLHNHRLLIPTCLHRLAAGCNLNRRSAATVEKAVELGLFSHVDTTQFNAMGAKGER